MEGGSSESKLAFWFDGNEKLDDGGGSSLSKVAFSLDGGETLNDGGSSSSKSAFLSEV